MSVKIPLKTFHMNRNKQSQANFRKLMKTNIYSKYIYNILCFARAFSSPVGKMKRPWLSGLRSVCIILTRGIWIFLWCVKVVFRGILPGEMQTHALHKSHGNLPFSSVPFRLSIFVFIEFKKKRIQNIRFLRSPFVHG